MVAEGKQVAERAHLQRDAAAYHLLAVSHDAEHRTELWAALSLLLSPTTPPTEDVCEPARGAIRSARSRPHQTQYRGAI